MKYSYFPFVALVPLLFLGCIHEPSATWPLHYQKEKETSINGYVYWDQRRFYDGVHFFIPGNMTLNIMDREGVLTHTIDIVAELAAAGVQSSFQDIELVSVINSKIFVGVNDGGLTDCTEELLCFDANDYHFLWKSTLADCSADPCIVDPVQWRDWIITAINYASGFDTHVRAIDLRDPTGATFIERRYPITCMNRGSTMVKNNQLWLTCLLTDLTRIDLDRFIDPSYSDEECVTYTIPGSEERYNRERNIYFLDDSYVLRTQGKIERRLYSDDSIMWLYEVDVKFPYWGSAPWTIYGENLIMSGDEGMLLCLDIDDGSQKWISSTWPEGATINNIDAAGCVIGGKWYAQYSFSYCTITIFDIETGEKLLEYEGTFADTGMNNLWAEGNRLYHTDCDKFIIYTITDPRLARTWLLVALWAGGSGGAGLLAFLAYRLATRSKRRKDREGGLGDRACVGEQEKAREEPFPSPLAMAASW